MNVDPTIVATVALFVVAAATPILGAWGRVRRDKRTARRCNATLDSYRVEQDTLRASDNNHRPKPPQVTA